MLKASDSDLKFILFSILYLDAFSMTIVMIREKEQ